MFICDQLLFLRLRVHQGERPPPIVEVDPGVLLYDIPAPLGP